MADPTSNDLPYGHFGQALYDPDEQTWNFERQPDASNILRLLGKPAVVARPIKTPHASESSQTRCRKPGERHAKEIRDLVKHLPEIQPASELLAPLLRVSEAVGCAAARHDPLQGSLLGIGTVPSEASHHTITVVAFPTGTTGSDLRIVQAQIQRRGWDDTKGAWIEVPTIRGGEAEWKGEGAPIQQICFAHAIERTDRFLAVRMLARTLIFRPALRKEPVHGSSISRLDANLCSEVSTSSTGGSPHADVAFNPWYTRQFGIVDQAGRWSVWELEGRSTTTGKCIHQGPARSESSGLIKALHDGWARITWVCGPSTVAVCTRRELALYNVTGADAESTWFIVLDKKLGDGWYLAMLQVPSQPAYLAVLTSEHLTIYHVEETGADAAKAETTMRIRHFRNAEDTTLTLAAFAPGDAVFIVLRSNIEPVVTVYRLLFRESGGVHASMPTELVPPYGITAPGNRHSLADLHFASVGFGTQPKAPERSLALQYRDRGWAFASLVLLGKDLTVYECLYTLSPANASSDDVAPPTWEARLGASATRLRKESFVVDDDEEVETIADGLMRLAPVSLHEQRRRSQAARRTGSQWTVSLELSAQAIDDGDGVETMAMSDAIEHAESLLRDQSMDGAIPWRTLRDLVQGELSVQDLEQSATMLNRLEQFELDQLRPSQDGVADTQPDTKLNIRPLGSQPTTSLSALYNDMVKDWITSLSPAVSGRTRLGKEQLVRRIAAEVALALRVVGTKAPEPEAQPETQQSQQSWDIPVRAGPSSLQTPGSSSQIASQHSVLPTPSPSATPSVVTGSSHPSNFAALEVSRLSRYTTFSKPTPSALSRSLNNVLSHWAVGRDPATYDWRVTTRRIAQRDVEADEQMTEKDRARVQRRAERHMRRQRREAAASQAAQLASSQALEIVSASQPPQASRVESQPVGVAASSQSQGLGIGIGPASQVVPGRFGGRPPKKKRKQGF